MDPDKPFELIPWPQEDSRRELEEGVEMIVINHKQNEDQVETAFVNFHQNSEFGERSKTLPIYYKFMESNKHLRRFSI